MSESISESMNTVKPGKIYKAISNCMKEIGAVGKNQRNDQQNFMYRGIDAVMNAINPALVNNGIFVVPQILEQFREDRQTRSGGNLIYSICKVKYTFFADDGSNISAIVIGEGMDSGDKATNKAMSVAFKYACFQVFCIPTEEMIDPDAECHEVAPKKSDSECHEVAPKKSDSKKEAANSEVNIDVLKQILKNNEITDEFLFKLYGIKGFNEVTPAKFKNIMDNIDKIKQKQTEASGKDVKANE